jgi:hypothetical protein
MILASCNCNAASVRHGPEQGLTIRPSQAEMDDLDKVKIFLYGKVLNAVLIQTQHRML